MQRELTDCLIHGCRRQIRIETLDRSPEVACKHDVAGIDPPQGAVGSEGFMVPCVNAFPTEFLLKVLCKRRLDEPVFGVDVGNHGGLYSRFERELR
jgi:hypothetical protein